MCRCRRLVPPCYVPQGDSPLSLLEEEEEEEGGLFKAIAVNEEGERDRAIPA